MPATPVTNTSAGRAPWGWSGASRTRPSPRACPGEGRGQPRGGALRQPEETQPEELGDPGAGRASVPYRQAAVRLHQGALSRAGEEHRPGDGADRPSEFVCSAPQVGDGVDNRIASAVCKWSTVTPKTPVKSALQTGQSVGGSQKKSHSGIRNRRNANK